MRYFRGRCKTGSYFGKQALFVRDKRGKEKVVVFVGGGKVSDARLIKGNSFGAVYVTEVNECHREFFFEVLDRTLASSDRKVFLDLNPKGKRHWFYREFLDWHDEKAKEGCKNGEDLIENGIGYQYAHFTIWDNLSVSDEKLRGVLETYDKGSLWYRSEILGLRVSAVGRIFEGWDSGKVKIYEGLVGKMRFDGFSIGVDIGGTDATVVSLVGFGGKEDVSRGKSGQHREVASANGKGSVVVIDGYYHKQGKSEGYTHDRYAKEIAGKVAEWCERLEGLESRCVCYCESADKLFRQALKNELRRVGVGMQVVASYKKDGILDRIRLMGVLVNQERLRIAERLGLWFSAFEEAAWDEKAMESGEWKRVDCGSGLVDVLDSVEYAVQPWKKRLI